MIRIAFNSPHIMGVQYYYTIISLLDLQYVCTYPCAYNMYIWSPQTFEGIKRAPCCCENGRTEQTSKARVRFKCVRFNRIPPKHKLNITYDTRMYTAYSSYSHKFFCCYYNNNNILCTFIINDNSSQDFLFIYYNFFLPFVCLRFSFVNYEPPIIPRINWPRAYFKYSKTCLLSCALCTWQERAVL